MVFSVGIDLGTSNCCISICDHTYKTEVVKIDGHELVESAVNFGNPNNIYVGRAATEGRTRDFVNGNVVRCNKRVLGRKFNDPNIQKLIKNCEAKVVADSDGLCAYDIPAMGRIVSTEEVLVEMIKKLYNSALKGRSGVIPESVCITIPTTFNQMQRYITRKAAEKVIKNCPIRFISEPSAAAIYYSLSTSIQNGHVLIYDLGGGTFDVSIIRITNGNQFEVLGQNGHPTIGGNAFDESIRDIVDTKYKKLAGDDDLSRDEDDNEVVYKSSMYKLLDMCRETKEGLSKVKKEEINLSDYFSFLNEKRKEAGEEAGEEADDDDEDCYGDEDIMISVRRAEFEKHITQYIKTTIDLTKECIQTCGLSNGDIDHILLVGGSCYIPLVKERLTEEFGDKIGADINPNTCVACGASLIGQRGYNSITEKNHLFITDRTSYGIGISCNSRDVKTLIPPNSLLPISGQQKFKENKHNKTGSVKCSVYEISSNGEKRPIKDLSVEDDFFIESNGVVIVVFSLTKEGVLTIEFRDGIRKDHVIQKETSILELV